MWRIKKKNKLGDLILPIAAIRGEGTSNDYFPPKYQLYRHLAYKKQYQQQFGIIKKIIGQEQCTPPIVEFGNMMMPLKNTFGQFVQWQ